MVEENKINPGRRGTRPMKQFAHQLHHYGDSELVGLI